MNRSGSRLCRVLLHYLPGRIEENHEQQVCLQADVEATHTMLDTVIECCLLQPSAVLCHEQFVAAPVVYNKTVYLEGNMEARSFDRPSSGNTTMHSVCIVGNTTMHSVCIVGNTTMHSVCIVGNTTMHSVCVVGNTTMHSVCIVGNTTMHSVCIVGNTAMHSVCIVGNTAMHSVCIVGNTTMHSVCIVELHVTVNYIKILTFAQQCFLW